MRRIAYIIICIAVILAAAYAGYYFRFATDSTPAPESGFMVDPTIDKGVVTVYRIGMLPPGFPKDLVPLAYRQKVRAQKKVFADGTEECDVLYAVDTTHGIYADAFVAIVQRDGWTVSDTRRTGSQAFIRAKLGSREVVHAQVTASNAGSAIMRIVYNKAGN